MEMQTAEVHTVHHKETGTFSYVVHDPACREAAIIDPVLDFDSAAARTATTTADALIEHVRALDLKVIWILETHAHADHLSAAPYLQEQLGGRIGIGRGITAVQNTFRDVLNLGDELQPDGSQFDHLFEDDERFTIGKLTARVIATPGHTSDSVTYLIGDAAFVGDSLFMPDAGTARCDFPGGDAQILWASTRRLFDLPEQTRMFMCHDYGPNGREIRWETSVGEQKKSNIHVGEGKTLDEFVVLRKARDSTLGMPKLILPAIQVNIRAGRFPQAEDDGTVFLKLPVNTL